MALYAPGKQRVVGGRYILTHQARWAEVAATASNIVIVGASLQKHDAHIWEPIAKSPAQLYVVDRKPADILTWSRSERRRDAVALGAGAGFGAAVTEIVHALTAR